MSVFGPHLIVIFLDHEMYSLELRNVFYGTPKDTYHLIYLYLGVAPHSFLTCHRRVLKLLVIIYVICSEVPVTVPSRSFVEPKEVR